MLPPSLTSTRVVLPPFVLATQLGVATAEPEVRPAARLDVKSSPSCTSRSDVVARVLSRAPNVRFVDSEAPIDVLVNVEARRPGAVIGEVTISRAGAQPSTRRVLTASCAEASDALAVIIAIALGKAKNGDEDSAAGERGTTGPSDATNRREAPPHASHAAPIAPGRALESEGGESNPGAAASPSSLNSRPRFALQLAAQSFVAPAPGVMLGIGAYATAGFDGASIWSPALVLGAARAWRSGVDARGGTASFTLDVAMIDACAVRFGFASIEARLCTSALGGRLSAEGSNTLNAPGAVARPFWAIGGSVLFTATVGARFEITARLAAGVNLVRDEFKFEPFVFHEVPPVTFAPSIGLGARFP